MVEMATGLVSIVRSGVLSVLEATVLGTTYGTVPSNPLVFVRKNVLVFLGLVDWTYDVLMHGLMGRWIGVMVGGLMAAFMLWSLV